VVGGGEDAAPPLPEQPATRIAPRASTILIKGRDTAAHNTRRVIGQRPAPNTPRARSFRFLARPTMLTQLEPPLAAAGELDCLACSQAPEVAISHRRRGMAEEISAPGSTTWRVSSVQRPYQSHGFEREAAAAL
jgi:hypothetical protein